MALFNFIGKLGFARERWGLRLENSRVREGYFAAFVVIGARLEGRVEVDQITLASLT